MKKDWCYSNESESTDANKYEMLKPFQESERKWFSQDVSCGEIRTVVVEAERRGGLINLVSSVYSADNERLWPWISICELLHWLYVLNLNPTNKPALGSRGGARAVSILFYTCVRYSCFYFIKESSGKCTYLLHLWDLHENHSRDIKYGAAAPMWNLAAGRNWDYSNTPFTRFALELSPPLRAASLTGSWLSGNLLWYKGAARHAPCCFELEQ